MTFCFTCNEVVEWRLCYVPYWNIFYVFPVVMIQYGIQLGIHLSDFFLYSYRSFHINMSRKHYTAHRVTGFLDFFIVRCSVEQEHDVSETWSVSVFRWRGEKTPTQLGLLETANLNAGQSLPFSWGQKQVQFPKRRVSTLLNTGRWKSPKIQQLCVL
jgi:hypothetical protein